MFGQRHFQVPGDGNPWPLLAVTLAVALPGVSADGGEDGNKDLAIPEKAELKYPNLGSSLDQLVTRVEEGEAPAAPSAGNAPGTPGRIGGGDHLPVRQRGRHG